MVTLTGCGAQRTHVGLALKDSIYWNHGEPIAYAGEAREARNEIYYMRCGEDNTNWQYFCRACAKRLGLVW